MAMVDTKHEPLHGYQFKYHSSILGCLVFWEGSLAQIAKILDDADGRRHGQVTLTNPRNGRVMGQPCIHNLISCAGDEIRLPKVVMPKKQNDTSLGFDPVSVSYSGCDEKDSFDIEPDEEAPATYADITRLEQKIDQLLSQFRTMSEHWEEGGSRRPFE